MDAKIVILVNLLNVRRKKTTQRENTWSDILSHQAFSSAADVKVFMLEFDKLSPTLSSVGGLPAVAAVAHRGGRP